MFYKDLYYKKMNNNQCMLNKIFFYNSTLTVV